MKRAAFTIWELLAVIVIILVIAAFLFPIFARTDRGHPRIACLSNEQQLGLAILQYVEDNDKRLPDIAAARGGTNTWRNAIYPYALREYVYECADRFEKSVGPDGFYQSYAANYTGNYSGSQNDHGDGAFAGPGSTGIRYDDIPEPRQLISLCEVSHHSTPDYNIDNLAAFNPGDHTLWAGHIGGGNYAFVDGHAKWFKPLDTKTFWHRNPHIPLTPAAVALLADAHNGGRE